jgi:excisionase family DNA binding protein
VKKKLMAPIAAPSYDLDGAAAFLNVSIEIVRRLVNKREIVSYKIGKGVRIFLPDLEDFLRRARQG